MSLPLSKSQARRIGELYRDLQASEQRIIDFIAERSSVAGSGFVDQDGLLQLKEAYERVVDAKRELISALQEAQDEQDLSRLTPLAYQGIEVVNQALNKLRNSQSVVRLDDTSLVDSLYPKGHWDWKVGGPELNPELHPKKDKDAQ